MTVQPQIVVRRTQDLWHALRRRGLVTLQLSYIDSRLQATTERRINFWRQVCGCQIGALLLLAMLVWRIPTMLRTPYWNWTALATEAGVVLLAAVGGKVLAIMGARLLLAIEIAVFLRRTRRRMPGAVEGRS